MLMRNEMDTPNLTPQYLRKNYGELLIHFGSLTVEHTDVYAKYEIFSASSAMGGLLGLFLGGSMMTLYELGEFLAVIVNVRLAKWASDGFFSNKNSVRVC